MSETARGAAPRPLLVLHDLKELALIVTLGGVALLPARCWMPLCRWISRLTLRLSPARTAALMAVLPGFLPALLGSQLEALVTSDAVRSRERVHALRAGSPIGWHPQLTLTGEHHLAVALAEGRGALLWIAQFGSFHLVVKRALTEEGFAPIHVSRDDAKSRFGSRVLFRIRARVEDRSLAGRIWLDAGDGAPRSGVAALRAIRAALADNRVVSSTVADTAQQLSWVPFCGGVLGLPPALPHLAQTTGTPLLPVFVRETGPDRFEVILEPPLDLTSTPATADALTAGMRSYAALLERHVRAQPDRWLGPWSYRRTPPGAEASPGQPAAVAARRGG